MVEDLAFKLRERRRIHVENVILTEENSVYRLKEAEHLTYEKATKKELTDPRKQLQIKDLRRAAKDERTFFLQREERLNQVTKEKRYPIGQLPAKEE